jgi:hypothetical protein
MNQMRFSWILMPVLIGLLSYFVTPVYCLDISLAWTSEPVVDGYKIYYKSGSSGPPYDGDGAAEGDSPIDVEWVDEFTLRALPDDEDYYLAITAYNEYGESGYSNEVTTARSVAVSTAGAAGGGGGGCFISALRSGNEK